MVVGREVALDEEEDQNGVSSATPLVILPVTAPRRASDATTVTSWATSPRTAPLNKIQRATIVVSLVTSSATVRSRQMLVEVAVLQDRHPTAVHATCVARPATWLATVRTKLATVGSATTVERWDTSLETVPKELVVVVKELEDSQTPTLRAAVSNVDQKTTELVTVLAVVTVGVLVDLARPSAATTATRSATSLATAQSRARNRRRSRRLARVTAPNRSPSVLNDIDRRYK